jgi:hypothetical protein
MENIPTEYNGKAFSQHMQKQKTSFVVWLKTDKCLGISLKLNYTAEGSKQKLLKSAVLCIQVHQDQTDTDRGLVQYRLPP